MDVSSYSPKLPHSKPNELRDHQEAGGRA